MTDHAESLRREIVRRCLRQQFDVPLAADAGMTEDQAVEAAIELIDAGFLRLEQIRKPRRRRPGLYRLVPILPGAGGRP